MRQLFILALLAFLSIPAQAAQVAPLHLEADIGRSELIAGDAVSIDAHLFNDGDATAPGDIQISAPEGFVALTDTQISGDIPAGGALSLRARYQVATDAPKGLARFVVRGGGQVATVVVRVGPPPSARVWVPMARGSP